MGDTHISCEIPQLSRIVRLLDDRTDYARIIIIYSKPRARCIGGVAWVRALRLQPHLYKDRGDTYIFNTSIIYAP